LAAHDPDFVAGLAGDDLEGEGLPKTLDAMLASREAHLTAYQDADYAAQYRAFVDDIAATLQSRGVPESNKFLMAVAEQLSRVMAYKDEYEVGRLFSDPSFRRAIGEAFDGDVTIKLNLGSPLLFAGEDAKTGRPKKVEIGAWALPFMGLLAKGKKLRGGRFDLFGRQAERKMERALIGEYRDLVAKLAQEATTENIAVATDIAASAYMVRGYGPVKEAGVAQWRAFVAEKLPLMQAKATSSSGLEAERESA